jgi:hypothetical protein
MLQRLCFNSTGPQKEQAKDSLAVAKTIDEGFRTKLSIGSHWESMVKSDSIYATWLVKHSFTSQVHLFEHPSWQLQQLLVLLARLHVVIAWHGSNDTC